MARKLIAIPQSTARAVSPRPRCSPSLSRINYSARSIPEYFVSVPRELSTDRIHVYSKRLSFVEFVTKEMNNETNLSGD